MTKAEYAAFRRWKENIGRLNDTRDEIMDEMRSLYERAGGGKLPDGYDIHAENDMYLRYLLTSENENTRNAALMAYRSYECVCAKYNAMIDLELEFRSVGCNGRSGCHPLEV